MTQQKNIVKIKKIPWKDISNFVVKKTKYHFSPAAQIKKGRKSKKMAILFKKNKPEISWLNHRPKSITAAL